MADTERLMNKAQGDDIISALATIAANILQVPSEKLIIDWSYTTLPASGNDHTIYAIPTGDADDPWNFYVWNDTDEEWVQFDWNFAVDSTLSTTSENPVQNKVVTEALNGKVDKVEGKGLSSNDFTDEDKEALDNMELDIASTQTISGNPLTLTDAAPINAESLVVELEPVQDLHGQDAPYVGGAGKNKLNMSDKTFSGSDAYFSEWTYNSGMDNAVELQAGVTYTLSFDITCNSMPCYVSVGAGNGYYSLDIAQVEITENGRAHITFTPTNESLTYGNILAFRAPRYNSPATYSGTLKNIMLEVGSSPTDYAPYSNICPITGYTECEVDDVGKNLFDGYVTSQTTIIGIGEDLSDVSLTDVYGTNITKNPNNILYVSFCAYLPKGTYTLTNVTQNVYISLNRIAIAGELSISANAHIRENGYAFTTAKDGYTWFSIERDDGYSSYNDIAFSGEELMFQIEKGTSVTSYEPYHSSNATIQFGQTVYGGKSDFVEGGTDDEWNKDDTFSGWYKSSTETSVIIKEITDKKGGTNQIYSNTYKYVSNQGFAVPEGAISDSTNSSYTTYVFVNDSRFAGKTIQECQAILESDGMYFVYQVETPTQLSTPPTDLKLHKGTNNLSTNGTIINLGYQSDNVVGELKGEIEKCSPNPEFMHFEANGNVVDAIPIIFDEAIHSYTVSGDNWKDKTFLCVECCDMRYGILQLVLSSDMAFVDSCGKALMLYPYMRSIEQYIKITISLGQSYGYEISYQTTSTSSLLDYLKIRVRLFN